MSSKFTVPDKVLYICTGSKCGKRGGKDMYKAMKSYLKHAGQHMEVIRTECTDRCDYAPVCALQPGNIWLKEYRQKDVFKLLMPKDD
ncbi:MAG TPA: (2Fe-2S) ferredoxin domain-containing protein [Mucilaginibacter sp.]